ncbi:MAG: TolC family protein [Verrucomicrobiales bacterium]
MPNPSQTGAAACLAMIALAAAASCTATRPALPDVGKAAWATPSAAGEIQGDWWRAFGSRDLDQRIGAALENNADLAMLAKRIDLARAQGAALGAGSWPRAEAGGGYRVGEESTRMTGFETRDVEPWDAAGSIAWEVDFLGKWRSRRRAARRGTDAAFADAAMQWLALAAEVASGVFPGAAPCRRSRLWSPHRRIRNLGSSRCCGTAKPPGWYSSDRRGAAGGGKASGSSARRTNAAARRPRRAAPRHAHGGARRIRRSAARQAPRPRCARAARRRPQRISRPPPGRCRSRGAGARRLRHRPRGEAGPVPEPIAKAGRQPRSGRADRTE